MELQYLMNEMNKSLQGSSATGLNILTEEGLSQARSQVIIQQTLYSSILYIYSLFFKVTSHGESGPSRVCSVIRMLPQREVGAIKQIFGTSVRCSSWSAFGRSMAVIKKLILRKLMGAPKDLGVDPFPDPVGHFGAPWRPFWIFEVLIEGMIESKNLFCES